MQNGILSTRLVALKFLFTTKITLRRSYIYSRPRPRKKPARLIVLNFAFVVTSRVLLMRGVFTPTVLYHCFVKFKVLSISRLVVCNLAKTQTI